MVERTDIAAKVTGQERMQYLKTVSTPSRRRRTGMESLRKIDTVPIMDSAFPIWAGWKDMDGVSDLGMSKRDDENRLLTESARPPCSTGVYACSTKKVLKQPATKASAPLEAQRVRMTGIESKPRTLSGLEAS